MSRTTPDPVFAAAARAEAERRVRASSGSAARQARRPWVMELTAIAGVAVIVAGVAAGISTLRPSLDAGGAPVGSVTQTTSPITGPSPLVTGSISEAPTEAPTKAPTTAPPLATTPPPTEAPTAPPTSSAPTTPPPTSSVALIGPTGAKARSAAEIRTWATSIGAGGIWAEQAVLDTACMAGHGFIWDVEFNYRAGAGAERIGLTDTQFQAYQVAEYGPDTGLPYTWQTAGCHGRSVHVTGQDDAN